MDTLTKPRLTVFQLIDAERNDALREHRFYVEQAMHRLLAQFGDISAEAERVEMECWEAAYRHSSSDEYDDGMAYEAARDHGIEFHQLLIDMHDRTRLSVVAGMYHHWDKRFRRFLIREMRWSGLVLGTNTKQAIWRFDSGKLEQLLIAFGLDIRTFPQFDRLDAMRLVVNVYKHGEGPAFIKLRQSYPEFVRVLDVGGRDFSDDTDMVVTDDHIKEFSSAIEAFWMALPECLTVDDGPISGIPNEFCKAFDNDLKEAETKR